MARVAPVARSVIDHGRLYQRGRPVEVEDEGLYHHLIRTGRFRDLDKMFEIMNPTHGLPRIHGQLVTVIRECGLGDVLMVATVIRAMKARFPKARFRLATGRAYVELLTGVPFLESCEPIMDIRGHVRNVIDLRGVAERHARREDLDRIDLFALVCGVTVEDYSSPIPPVGAEDRARARLLTGPGRLLALAVRGSTHVRTWPERHLREFAELATLSGWTVVALDPAPVAMPEHPRIRDLTGRVGLQDVKAILAESEICVCSDSGLQHLAEAVGTRVLALYSTTPPALRIGHYRNVRAIWRESLSCVPCFDRGCPPAPCMEIPPALVLRAIENWERLPLATDIDAPSSFLLEPEIRIAGELELMRAWRESGAVTVNPGAGPKAVPPANPSCP